MCTHMVGFVSELRRYEKSIFAEGVSCVRYIM